MELLPWTVIGPIALLAILGSVVYRSLVRRRTAVDEAWSELSLELRRRHDLIPALVRAVRGAVESERDMLRRLIQARSAAVTATEAGVRNAAHAAAAENRLTAALAQLVALVRNHPDVRADEKVSQLLQELATTEREIRSSAQRYNSVVRAFNTAIGAFPNVILAPPMGFGARDSFRAEDGAALPDADVGMSA